MAIVQDAIQNKPPARDVMSVTHAFFVDFALIVLINLWTFICWRAASPWL